MFVETAGERASRQRLANSRDGHLMRISRLWIALAVVVHWAGPAMAQPAGNADLTNDVYLDDTILATPGQTPVPQDNLFATAPGAEQAAPTPQFTFNALAPLFFNSNPEFRSSGGPQSLEGSPVTRLSWASQLFGTPLRISGAASLEWERFPSADAAVDFFRSSARIQYVDSGNDQAFSPFFAYVPRMDFDPTFGENFATRQDLNLGVQKRFNFDGAFNPVPISGNSSAQTVWSFGLTATAQRRIRNVTPQSNAMIFAPSASWVISENWNASLDTAITRRWFNGASQDLTVEQVGVLEYVIPSN